MLWVLVIGCAYLWGSVSIFVHLTSTLTQTGTKILLTPWQPWNCTAFMMRLHLFHCHHTFLQKEMNWGTTVYLTTTSKKKAQTHAYRHIQTLSWCVIHITIYYSDSLRHLIKHKTRLEHQMNIREIVLVMKYRKNNHTCTSTLLIIISHNDGRQKVIVWKSDSWWNETEWCVNLDYFTLKKWRILFISLPLFFCPEGATLPLESSKKHTWTSDTTEVRMYRANETSE